MEMRKEKHLMNNKGETKGYDIIIKVGNKEYSSWWTSPPKENFIFDKDYLKDRYWIIITDKRAQEFSRLWSEICIKNLEPQIKTLLDLWEAKSE